MALHNLFTQLKMESVRKGQELLTKKEYEEAKDIFWTEAKKIVGPSIRLPSIGGIEDGDCVRSGFYTNMPPYELATLMACCNGMAQYYLSKDDVESALVWFEEIYILYMNTHFAQTETPLYDWFDHSLDLPELTFQRVTALIDSGKQFRKLGNTATAAERIWVSITSSQSLPSPHHTPALKRMLDPQRLIEAIQLRNPDPKLCNKLSVTHPRLQLLGSWKKLSLKPGTRSIGGRLRFSSFIWNKHLYVFGGWKGEIGSPFYKDFWCLDLEDEAERTWRKLPDYPIPVPAAISFAMVVDDNTKRAYLITGRPDVDFFDLQTERWGSMNTLFRPTDEDRQCGVKGNWPWPGKLLHDATIVINNGKIYTFGGDHRETSLGCNLFMELDLATRTWRRLTGYAMAPQNADYTCPGPRVSACGWVGPGKKRIYLFCGQANRDGAKMKNERHGADIGFAYNDFWSWDIEEAKWRRERLSGNLPALRTEMAYTFNEKLNKAVVFGGYAPCISTLYPEKNVRYDYTYYADTFIYDHEQPDSPLPSYTSTPPTELTAPSTTSYPSWRQVLTRGFPTYRCHAHLHTDPDTGKMYLFGGYTNTDYVPSRQTFMTRPFGDVWQLRVDLGPLGDFATVDIEEEARTASAGPWQRCFGCGNAGRWRRCAGSCKGKAFFCGVECQREGWKEHKVVHKCKKV